MIGVYGRGGLGREIAAYLTALGIEHVMFDDNDPWVSGSLEGILVAVGDPKVREAMRRKVTNLAPAMVLATFMGRDVIVEGGAMLCPGTILTCDIRVEECALVNIGATIGHDCIIGAFSSVQPGANLTGRVHVGRGAYVGIGATIINRTTKPLIIGDYAVIGGGAVVLDHVRAGATVVGVPSREVS